MIRRPMLIAAVSFIFCIAVWWFFGIGFFVASLFLCIGILAFIHKSFLNILLSSLLLVLLLFSVLSVNGRISNAYNINGKQFTGKFIVCSEPVAKKNMCVTVKSYDNPSIKNGMKFDLYYSGGDFKVGEKITVNVNSIKTEDDDQLRALFKNGTYGRLWLKERLGSDGTDPFYSLVGKVRSFVKSYFSKNLSYDSYATITGIMLGDRASFSQAFSDSVRSSGASHIMAVSGLHLSVIMGLLFFIAERLIGNRYIRFAIIFLAVAFICAICAFTPSIVRAGTMFVLFAVPPLFGRDTDRLSVLSLSLVLLLLYSPTLLFNSSMQMSFFAVVAVMLVTPGYTEVIESKLPFKNKTVFAVVETLLVSLFAQIFTLPFSIYSFKTVSLAAPVTNLFVSLAVTAVLVLGVLSLALSFLPYVSGYILFLLEKGISYINFVIGFFGDLKYSSFAVDKMFCIIPALIAVLLTAGLYFINRRKENAVF